MNAPHWLIALRNGALLATLAATPIIVGYLWDALWGTRASVTAGMYAALVLAWLVSAGAVAALTWNVMRERDADAVKWFYPCTRCGNRVAIISYRCLRCRASFTPPSEADAFRSALLLGVGIFYALFAIAIIALMMSRS